MKKIKLNPGLLELKKETIAQLTNDQMKSVFGGLTQSTAIVCTASGAQVCNPKSANCGGTLQCTIGCPPSAACPVDTDNCDSYHVGANCSFDSCGPGVC
jgi:hypothetical protein